MKWTAVLFPFFSMACFLIGGTVCTYSQETATSHTYYYKINDPQSPEDLRDGLQYYQQQLEQQLKEQDTLNSIYSYRMIAIAQNELGDYYAAENTIVSAFKMIDAYSKPEPLKNDLTGLYNQLGKIYRALFNYEKAQETYRKGLGFAQNAKDSCTLINNLGNVYKETQAYAKAMDAYQRALRIGEGKITTTAEARTLDNLGFVSFQLDSLSGLPYIKRALKLRQEAQDMEGLYSSYKTLSLFHQHKGDLEKAQQTSLQALEIAKKISPSYQKDALELVLGQRQDSLVLQYSALSDTLNKSKQIAENKNAAIRYDVEKERQTSETLKMEKEWERRLRIFIQAYAFIIFLVIGWLFYVFRNKQRTKLAQQVYLTETRISKKVHDEVANDLYGIMTKIQKDDSFKKDLLDDLEGVYHKTRDISRENNFIDYEENFNEVLSDLFSIYHTHQLNIVPKNQRTVPWQKITTPKKTVLYRVLQELLTNSKKYSEATIIVVIFAYKNGKLVVTYSDYGVGTELKKKGGLLNTENRIKSIGGKISFETAPNEGFKAKIQI
ncbi:MAG: ATP-binding protein [Flavobacteriaceae bacterium]|nr:ATP-binding protein [Flavobacteriaceae bacterium]|tara:strand:+ start:17751 stop:19403 length:1653 start_codon:yes stop_codon:yes gene_type:complete